MATRRKPPRFINRELSWLEFNDRVLEEARDKRIPLLERLKFLAITSSNLDEFFMVRVGGLQMLAKKGRTRKDPAGMTPKQQLKAISQRTHQMVADQYRCYLDELQPGLAKAGILCRRVGDASERQSSFLKQVFENEIYPVLTPMAVTDAEEFPLLVNGALNVIVRLEPDPSDADEPRYAIIPIGRASSRFITLPAVGGYEYVMIEDVIEAYITRFFPGEQVTEVVPFRITRNADLSVREDLAADLLGEMEHILDARKSSDCVRLELSEHASKMLRKFLQQALAVGKDEVYAVPGPLNLAAFMALTDLSGFDDLKDEKWPPLPSPQVDPKMSMFEVLSNEDVLLYHPYDSFDPVVRLIEEAAADPDVLAIKQILYRTSRNSPIVAALKRAAEQGKHVTVIVELKARFDEAQNIEWAKDLEQSEVQVIYGIKGLKTHAKLCVIIRREPHGIQKYIHFGTGNYNEKTARLYSDVSYMTCDEVLAGDATTFLNTITGYSHPQHFRKIESAPIGLRERLLEAIAVETARRRQGQKARILAKLNSLVDPKIIEALYEASQAGVKIHLNIRGICCLRPGIKGLSENITVVSVVDRYLEHARIMYFHNGGDPQVFISSADWMPRNLDRRIELLTPVEHPPSRGKLIDILELCFRDNVKARQLTEDGSYVRLKPRGRAKPVRLQETHYRQLQTEVKQREHYQRSLFEPYRPPGSEL